MAALTFVLKGQVRGGFHQILYYSNKHLNTQEKHCFKTQNLLYFYVRTPEWLRLFCLSSQWKGEIQEFCPNTKMLLVGCKSDLRTDLSTLVELSNHRQAPVSYDQVCRLKEHFEMVDGSNFLTLIRSLPCLIDPCESVQILSLLTQALYKKQNLSKPERFPS